MRVQALLQQYTNPKALCKYAHRFDEQTARAIRMEAHGFRQSAIEAEVFLADEVAIYHDHHEKEEWDRADDMTDLFAPFDKMLVEWKVPRFIRSHGEWMPHPMELFDQIGVLIESMAGDSVQSLMRRARFIENRAIAHRIREMAEHAHHILAMTPCAVANGRPIYLSMPTFVAVSETGAWLKELATSPSDEVLEASQAWVPIALLTLTMANSKGVVVEDVTDEEAPSPKWHRRMRVKRNTYRLVKLGIDAKRRRHASSDDVEHDGVALHRCRGHLKRYTEERPLFGKYVGSFWTPPHLKGSAKNGVTLKDYAVAPRA